MNRFAIAMMLSIGIAAAVPLGAQEPSVVDLAGLDLKVVGATVVPQVARAGGVVTANPGYRLVTVKMAGAFKKAGRATVSAALFAVTYEEYEPLLGRMRTKGRNAELVLMEGTAEWSTQYDHEALVPGPVAITFAVSLPVAVQAFSVLVAAKVGTTEVAAP